MDRKAKACALLMGASLAVLAAVPACAQSAAGEGAGAGDIIVTARRAEERLQDVPISITVFSQQQIANRNVITSSDLAIYTPSLSVNQRYGPEKAAFQIRGFNQDQATAAAVGVYFADVVAPRSGGGTTGGGVTPTGSFMDLQNVQVLKGPQGTLFGRNTTGGAVLLVPQRPTDRLEGWIEGSGGNYGAWRAQGVLNVPLADTFKVRVSVDRNHRDGYMKNHSGIGPADFNDVDYVYARLGVLAELTPNLENYTLAHFSHSFTNGYAGRIVACNPNLRVGGNPALVTGGQIITATPACNQLDRQNARGDGPTDVDVNANHSALDIAQWQVINTTTWTASDALTIKNIASYSEYRENSTFTLNGDNFVSDFGVLNGRYPSAAAPYRAGLPFVYIGVGRTANGHTAAQSTFTEELQFQGRTGDGRLNWQLGGYAEVSNPLGFTSGYSPILVNCADTSRLLCDATFPGGSSISAPATKLSYRSKGVYAQATYKLTDAFSATGGLRYTWDTTRGIGQSVRFAPQANGTLVETCNNVVRFNAGKNPATGGLIPLVVTEAERCLGGPPPAKSSAPTWLIDLDYKPTSDLLVYAKYARGYRAGGLNLTTVGAESWGPEKVDSYEIGAKATFRGAISGYLNVAAYYNDFKNMQVPAAAISNVIGYSGGSAIVNAGKARIQGFEADASVMPVRGLRFDLGYTYLDTKLISIVTPTVPAGAPYSSITPTALAGGPLAQSPKNRVTLTGTYTLPLDSSIGEISFGATYIHTDRQVLSQATLGSPTASPSYQKIAAAGGLPPIIASYLSGQPDFRFEPATDLVNLNVNWNAVLGTTFDAAFFVTNLTNQKYPVGLGTSWNSAGFENLLYGQPRIWGFKLRYSFGG